MGCPGLGGQGRDLQQLNLPLGLGQLQLSPRECAVQAALLGTKPHCVLVAAELLPLYLGGESRRGAGCREGGALGEC